MNASARRWQYAALGLNAFGMFAGYTQGALLIALLCTVGLFWGGAALVYGRPASSRRVVPGDTTPTPRERL